MLMKVMGLLLLLLLTVSVVCLLQLLFTDGIKQSAVDAAGLCSEKFTFDPAFN